MADAIVSGDIEHRNEADFRATVSCLSSGPSGSIRGEIEVESNGRDIDYSFRSSRPSRIITRRSGVTRYVYAVFQNASISTRSSSTSGATITLTARTDSNGRRTANLVITRPGRTTLRSSGRLDDGRITVNKAVSCRRS